MPKVGYITAGTGDLIDEVAPLKGWDGVLNVNRVDSQGRVRLVGNFIIVFVLRRRG